MKTFNECCHEVAIKHGLGKTLVIGHKPVYFTEAAELYAAQFKSHPSKSLEAAAENLAAELFDNNHNCRDSNGMPAIYPIKFVQIVSKALLKFHHQQTAALLPSDDEIKKMLERPCKSYNDEGELIIDTTQYDMQKYEGAKMMRDLIAGKQCNNRTPQPD